MPDIIFDLKKKTLSWPSKNLSWNAVSGPFGAGALPPGLYDISRREVTDYTSKVDAPYRDKQTGMGFFVPIYPKFKTNRGKSGGRLGIHPDGNVPGTLGCIGISSSSKSFHDAIKLTSPSVKLILQVK